MEIPPRWGYGYALDAHFTGPLGRHEIGRLKPIVKVEAAIRRNAASNEDRFEVGELHFYQLVDQAPSTCR